ncbi:MAG: methionine adenosyltransferase, partial [Planctomycetota bacterium]
PDKLADQISDAILDACLRDDPYSRVACETLLSKELVVIAGEITSKAKPNFEAIARQVLRDVGYTNSAIGIDADRCEIKLSISQQAGDIARGVVESQRDETLGAGDQGLMFGFACDETPELLPLPISLAHRILGELTRLRKSKAVDSLRPDAKSQVTVEYRDGRPWAIDTVVLSTQHDESVELDELKSFVEEKVIKPLLPKELLKREPKLHINPTGRFVEGGPAADCGLTGRKIIVDSYGGFARHGGGAFSGKDPTKVDRTAAYAARHIAKNLVAAGLAQRCEVQVAYAIGVAEPVSVLVETFGTSRYSSAELTAAVRSLFQLTPAAIIRNFQMRQPIYRPLAVGGHFGRVELNVGWEQLDRVGELKAWFSGK